MQKVYKSMDSDAKFQRWTLEDEQEALEQTRKELDELKAWKNNLDLNSKEQNMISRGDVWSTSVHWNVEQLNFS